MVVPVTSSGDKKGAETQGQSSRSRSGLPVKEGDQKAVKQRADDTLDELAKAMGLTPDELLTQVWGASPRELPVRRVSKCR